MITGSLYMFWPVKWFGFLRGITGWEELHLLHLPVSFIINQWSTWNTWSPSFFIQSESSTNLICLILCRIFFILVARARTEILGCIMWQSWYLFIPGSSSGVDREQHLWKCILKACDYTIFSRHIQLWLLECLQIDVPLLPLMFWFPLSLSHSLRCASCHKRPAFFSVSRDNKKSFNTQLLKQLTVPPDVGRMSSCFLVDRFNSDPSHPCIFPDQKNIRSYPDHHPGHGDHWRLRRVRVFPPQSIHWVGQVDCVRNVPQQTQHCQEKSQPARDWAVLLHGERRVKKKGLLLYTNKNSETKVSSQWK